MTPQRHEQIKKVFLAASLLHESDRPAFLDEACAGDADLRAEIESLLKHHDPATLIEPPVGRIPVAPTQPAAQTAQEVHGQEVPVGHSHVRDQDEQGRFIPGTVIAGRYRINSLLGRGGMGEVYRADDLTLSQPVALKFITASRSTDHQWLERFRDEVRLSRQVTHPNVCRVFDIGQADGETFLSMEYVDGEDLASLLRRVGRLSSDKTIEIARQICAGLGAAHDNGILHRDLKPANIMIDSNGRVRITDFGIAAAVARPGQPGLVAGSPSYIAPELLQGKPATVQSDIYSLGLVLYETATGRQASPAASFAARLEPHDLPPAPSTLVKSIDPALERVILQCIDEDPQQRPASVYAVAAALPGADPLLAAMAAGQTPAPGLLAAARRAAMRPATAIAVILWAVLGLLTVLLLSGRTFLLSQAAHGKPAAVLADRAQDIVRTLAGTTDPRGLARGFVLDRTVLADSSRSRTTLPLHFEYRQGTLPPATTGPFEVPSPFGMTLPGASTKVVRLDPGGRLLLYLALPATSASTAPEPRTINWAGVFKLAGLDIRDYEPQATPERFPIFADTKMAWTRVCDTDGGTARQVQAASLGGQVLYFHAGLPDAALAPSLARWPMIIRDSLFLLVLAAAAILTSRNLKTGRGDRGGAWRLATIVFVIQAALWLIRRSYVSDRADETAEIIANLRFATFGALVAWVFYMAMEMPVRRFWPHAIISWTKVLAGRLRDPLLARDLLLGSAVGVSMVLSEQAAALIRAKIGTTANQWVLPPNDNLGLLSGVRYMLGMVAEGSLQAIWGGLITLLLMLLLRMTFRRALPATAAFVAITSFALTFVYPFLGGSWITSLIIAVGLAVLLTRASLLAGMVALFCDSIIRSGIPTLDRHAWCADITGFTLTILGTLLVLGLYVTFSCQMPVTQKTQS